MPRRNALRVLRAAHAPCPSRGIAAVDSPALLARARSWVELGHGAFHWTKDERRTMRWGAFFLDDPLDDQQLESVDTFHFPAYDHEALEALRGRRVRLCAEVVELAAAPLAKHTTLRDFLDVRLGDVVELGVGILRIERADRALRLPGHVLLALQTGRRRTCWLRPDAFWHLRGQTVSLHARLTREVFAPTFAEVAADEGAQRLPIVRGGGRHRVATMGHPEVARRADAAWKAAGRK